jgi:hypothetical protein
MKIGSVGAELFYADGRTDMTKLTVAFRNFANAPKTTDMSLLKVYVTCVGSAPVWSHVRIIRL